MRETLGVKSQLQVMSVTDTYTLMSNRIESATHLAVWMKHSLGGLGHCPSNTQRQPFSDTQNLLNPASSTKHKGYSHVATRAA